MLIKFLPHKLCTVYVHCCYERSVKSGRSEFGQCVRPGTVAGLQRLQSALYTAKCFTVW